MSREQERQNKFTEKMFGFSKPAPATAGEWTVEQDGPSWWRVMSPDGQVMRGEWHHCESVKCKHNAALAANDDKWRERFRKFEKIEDKFGKASQRPAPATAEEPEKNLNEIDWQMTMNRKPAVEAAKIDGWYKGRDHERKLISEEMQQLREQIKFFLPDANRERDEAIEQLNAAVEALDFYCEQTDDGHRAKAVLAKIGEGK